ncbi:helix-turn-helix domain-containing protein [Oligella urethralis]|uniref:helix-turn-helix domain-containing protein n=1 Tax=Oligella urethralis TaxID=90245 RepID=UPI002432DE89|nr:helix-turn-helix domain-containing protein [Oligella urethralis]
MTNQNDTSTNRGFKGVWIPASIYLNPNLSPIEKILLAEIDSLSRGDKGCFASNNHLARFLQVSASRVSRIITGLSEKGLIKIFLNKKGKQITSRKIIVLYQKLHEEIDQNNENYEQKNEENSSKNDQLEGSSKRNEGSSETQIGSSKTQGGSSKTPSITIQESNTVSNTDSAPLTSDDVSDDQEKKPSRTKRPMVTLQTFLENCEANGESFIRDYHPIWEYAQSIGLPDDMVVLACEEFIRKFTEEEQGKKKKYADWRLSFKNYVAKGWLGLWFANQDGYKLTTAGVQQARYFEMDSLLGGVTC